MPEEYYEDADVLGVLKKMQQQLAFLEKKIDILIGQSERPFSKPSRSFDRPYGQRGEGGSERKFRSGRNFEKRHGEEREEFQGRKKHYGEDREREERRGHGDFKKFGEKKQFGKKKHFK
jgi:hypothetical protein